MNIKKILLIGLIVITLVGLIYVAIPKYQIQSVRVDGDTIAITRINTITGQVSIKYRSSSDKIVNYPWND